MDVHIERGPNDNGAPFWSPRRYNSLFFHWLLHLIPFTSVYYCYYNYLHIHYPVAHRFHHFKFSTCSRLP